MIDKGVRVIMYFEVPFQEYIFVATMEYELYTYIYTALLRSALHYTTYIR